jgi:hypothetical protein
MGDDFVFAAHFYMAQRSDGRRAARHQEGVGDGGQRADGVSAGLFDIAKDEDGNGARRADSNVDVGSDDLFGLGNDVFGHLFVSHAGHINRPDLRNGDFPIPVHRQGMLGV